MIAVLCALSGLIIIALLVAVIGRNVAWSYDVISAQDRLLLQKRRVEKAKSVNAGIVPQQVQAAVFIQAEEIKI